MRKLLQKVWLNPYFALLRIAWKYAREKRRRYALTYTLFLLSNVFVMLTPVIWGLFIDRLQLEGMRALELAWIYGAAYLALHFLDWGCHYPARLMERELAFTLSQNMLQELYQKTLQLPLEWHQDHHSGATINRVRKAYEAMKEFFDFGFAYFQTFTKMLFALAAMVYFSPFFGTLAVFVSVAIIYIILRFDKPYIAASEETNEREHEVSSTLFDSLSNIITVITLRLEKRMEEGLLSRLRAIWPPFQRQTRVNENKWFVVESVLAILYVLIVVGYVYRAYEPGEVFLIGALVTLVGYISQYNAVFQGFAWQYTQIVRHYADVKAADLIEDAYRERHRPEAATTLPPRWQTLDINRLNFHHRPAEGQLPRTTLDEVSIHIGRGRRVAVIGESGCGKSTLLAVLRGLYPPRSLSLRLDGRPLDSLAAVSDCVTLLPQEPEIFENTISYNITLGLPFAPQEIGRVMEIAAFSDVVAQLPQGLESNIKEKGVNLSGGQKQRLALARGILAAQSSDIVLLDEPTSSVDPRTELQIYQRLFVEFADKAIVSSLHRLHLLRYFDYVYVMDQGRVVDEGTFDELLTGSEIFQRMWAHQEDDQRTVIGE